MATLKPPSNIYGVTANARPQVQPIKNVISKPINSSQVTKSIKNNAGIKATQPQGFDQAGYLKTMQDQVNSMYDAQKQSQLQAFYNQRDKAVGQINQQKAALTPMYADKRNQSDVVSSQNVQALKEQMANAGLQGSGENVTASVGMNNARLGALANLNQQEQQQVDDYNRQITDLNDPSQEQAITSAIDAQRMQALYDASMRADDTGYQRSRDAIGDTRYADETSYSRGRDTLGDKRYDSETAYSHSQDALNRHDSNYWNKVNQNNVTRNYNRDVFTQDRSWNNVSPADQKMLQLQLQKSLAIKSAGRSTKSTSSSKKKASDKKVSNPNTQGGKLPGKVPTVAPQTQDAYARKMAAIMEPEMYQAYLVAEDKKRREELAKEKAKSTKKKK